jgi:hypothetical protein
MDDMNIESSPPLRHPEGREPVHDGPRKPDTIVHSFVAYPLCCLRIAGGSATAGAVNSSESSAGLGALNNGSSRSSLSTTAASSIGVEGGPSGQSVTDSGSLPKKLVS